jgi:hypothetical protein
MKNQSKLPDCAGLAEIASFGQLFGTHVKLTQQFVQGLFVFLALVSLVVTSSHPKNNVRNPCLWTLHRCKSIAQLFEDK